MFTHTVALPLPCNDGKPITVTSLLQMRRQPAPLTRTRTYTLRDATVVFALDLVLSPAYTNASGDILIAVSAALVAVAVAALGVVLTGATAPPLTRTQ